MPSDGAVVRLAACAYTLWSESVTGAKSRILITNFSCEISDSDKKRNSVKFTWYFMEENHPFYEIAAD